MALLLEIAFVVLLVLKITGSTFSWWWLAAPFAVGAVVAVFAMALMVADGRRRGQ